MKRKAKRSAAKKSRTPKPRKVSQRVLAARSHYRRNLEVLRENFSGFDSRAGYRKNPPTRREYRSKKSFERAQVNFRKAQRVVSSHREIVAGIVRRQHYPHRTINLKSAPRRLREAVKPYEFPGIKNHAVKRAYIFTTDKKAKISANRDGSLRIKEYGAVRDVYPMRGKELLQDPNQFYKDTQKFMRAKKASNISFNLGGNVISQVYRRDDFDPKNPTALFVNKVNSYLSRRTPSAIRDFAEAFQGISIFRGGRRRAEISVERIADLLRARRKARKQSRRALLTGRA